MARDHLLRCSHRCPSRPLPYWSGAPLLDGALRAGVRDTAWSATVSGLKPGLGNCTKVVEGASARDTGGVVLQFLDELGHDLVRIADQTIIGDIENRRVWIAVDCHN